MTTQDDSPALKNEPGQDVSQASSDAPPTLRLTSISKLYSGVAALSDVSVEFRPGEVHAILGENGAGKSTLMNVSSGTVQPDGGTIEFETELIQRLTPALAAQLGIAIVHQHPAVLPDMTVLENLQVSLPRSVFAGSTDVEVAERLLDSVNLHVHLRDRVESLTVAQKHLLEIAKALATRPKLLILDEPTAPLSQDATDMLFEKVRSVVAEGTSVAYITHRLAEVREIAKRVTVLRDGRLRGHADVADITDEQLLGLIVGRKLESTFPAKAHEPDSPVNLVLDSISGEGFEDVSIVGRRGRIIGVAGVVGNGQAELMHALAGLVPITGGVSIDGRAFSSRDLLRDAAFMPGDRHVEGLAMTLSVRENAALAALHKFRSARILNRKQELGRVGTSLEELAVKAPSLDAPVSALSGGNQQKVVMARALLSEPSMLVADEPTQGVDVGARAEIYRILREVSASGIPVIVNSSDAKELEGLCDDVIVMSRGRVVRTLSGDDVIEEKIIGAAVSATTKAVHAEDLGTTDAKASASGIRRFLQGDYAPSALLVVVIAVLTVLISGQNARYLSPFNIGNILLLATALGFIGLGQTIALLLGGIDLSVGPLAGFLVVAGSFFINDNQSIGTIALGFALMIVIAGAVGLINGGLIRFGRFTPIAATLTLYIGIQGLSFVLRDGPGGYINQGVVAAITGAVGPFPVAFLVLVAAAVAAEFCLRRRRWGWRLRATGSDEESARRIGIKIDRTTILGYVATSLFTAVGAFMLMAQIGVGDPSQGVTYTLASITAVVLGGTSLLGGRGTFIGTLLGAVLLTQVLNATSFLGLSQTFQYVFQGILIVAAAVLYSVVRRKRKQTAH
ncbi:ATP-binding cassette domain-containing protein [Sinomonas soli]